MNLYKDTSVKVHKKCKKMLIFQKKMLIFHATCDFQKLFFLFQTSFF